MNKFQAEKIINAYGGAIAASKKIFKKQSTLPCSKAKIRYAFYTYIATIIDEIGYLPEDMRLNLVGTYSMLDAFIPDEDAERLNKIAEKIKNRQLKAENPEDKKQIDEYFSLVRNAIRNWNYYDEINEYISECYKEKGIKE